MIPLTSSRDRPLSIEESHYATPPRTATLQLDRETADLESKRAREHRQFCQLFDLAIL